MKYLIISDTHLTHRFDQKKFDKLKEVISRCDRLIINGDFWDSYLTHFDDFINSKWSELFPLLESKEAIYIFGNHDQYKEADGRMYGFCSKVTESIKLEVDGLKLHIEHGHNIAPNIDMTFSTIFGSSLTQIGAHIAEVALVYMFRKNYFQLFRGMNKIMKGWAKNYLEKDEILICGHSHLPEYNLKEQFINLGLIRYGFCQCIMIEDGKINIINESY